MTLQRSLHPTHLFSSFALQIAYTHKAFYKCVAAWALYFQVTYPKMGAVGWYLKWYVLAYPFIWENIMPHDLLDVYGYWQISWRKVYEKYLWESCMAYLVERRKERERGGGIKKEGYVSFMLEMTAAVVKWYIKPNSNVIGTGFDSQCRWAPASPTLDTFQRIQNNCQWHQTAEVHGKMLIQKG